jgi:tetratricopeptide (TPR) repeat protein
VAALRGHPAALQANRARAAVALEYADLSDRVGRSDRALDHLADLAAREPLNEKAHAQLMLTLAALGQQAAALRAYEELRLRLDEQLGVLPGRELAEAHLRVLRQEVPPANAEAATGRTGLILTEAGQSVPGGGTAGQPPASFPGGERETGSSAARLAATCALIGRDSELAMLAGLVTELAARRGNSVLIEGEPGIGKSALVRAALADAADGGCQVFWGVGDELGQALPLLPLLEALRVREPSDNPRRGSILRLLHGEVTADRGMDVSAALAEQLLALIAEQCAARPTILVIDDLQWADQASITLWGRLARSVRYVPLLLIGMMRPVPQRDDLLALRRAASDAARLQLTGLTETAVADLLAALAGRRPGARPRPSPLDRRSPIGRRTRCIAAASWTTTRPSCNRPRSGMATPVGNCLALRRWRRPLTASPASTTATGHGPRSPRPWKSIPRLALSRMSPGYRPSPAVTVFEVSPENERARAGAGELDQAAALAGASDEGWLDPASPVIQVLSECGQLAFHSVSPVITSIKCHALLLGFEFGGDPSSVCFWSRR